MTFTNWLTTDPLRHPYEPLAVEDMVSIDAMHISATRRWPGGFFASYHAYPVLPGLPRADSALPAPATRTRPSSRSCARTTAARR